MVHADEHGQVLEHIQLVADQLHDAVQAGDGEVGRAVNVGLDTDQVVVRVGVAVDVVGLVVLEGHEVLGKFFQHDEYSFQIVALCLAFELQNFGVV
ncbi:ABC transmembrane type-1 domain-containing protein, partial [Dysosmobacter welbionis]